ncbi:MAG: lactate/malate family dehydrogenase, partial [Mycoplasmatales bacterium]
MAKQKVVVVGTGMVGASYAYALVNQCLVDELVLIDNKKQTAEAHAEDMKHGICYLEKQPFIFAGEYSDCKDADIVCITAGAAQKPGQSRLDLVEVNASIMTKIVR